MVNGSPERNKGVIMDFRNVICRTEGCNLFEQEHQREFDVNLEEGFEWGAWVCPSCGITHEYEAERAYDYSGPESAAHAWGEK
jgi:rubrerythrin